MTTISADTASTTTHTWIWRGFPIRYQTQGTTGLCPPPRSHGSAWKPASSAPGEYRPAVVMVHGFGASCAHWRKNLPVLGTACRCYAIDLIGFGGSAKPTPGVDIDYTFATWGEQIADFCQEVVGDRVFLVGNSIGCIALMQTAVDYPELAYGVVLIDCSLRLLHERRRHQLSWHQRFGAPILQNMLAVKWIGQLFFNQIAQPQVVRKILLQAYMRPEAVTDELVDLLMAPARDTGAVDVFVAFTRYSTGPLPEDLLAELKCPALILWGTEDPWEPVDLGRQLAEFPAVEKFIPLAGVGHCPQDEAPALVNPILLDWIEKLQGKNQN
ncbi:MAG: alpha/beta fold hydrolase [Hormoscilla sp. SP5CHS1]|nr:alpha/beta fold hydrolase [Hormoscilla sp. SP12CHS1]MBC6454131.1 alpha/beta fold hydrolase [Hormoscilla sp. SP5CHS1]